MDIKKVLLSAALVLGFAGLAAAASGPLLVPTGPNQALPTSDYGGVDRTTMSFSSANTVCFLGQGSIVGFIVSSGSSINDFIMFSDSLPVALQTNGSTIPITTGNGGVYLTSGAVSGGQNQTDDYNTINEVFRYYLSTTAAVSGSVANFGQNNLGTYVKLPVAVRFYGSLLVKMSTNIYQRVVILWTKFRQ